MNAVANFCFQTKATNLRISDRPPSEYFAETEARHPGALASQWIPMDRELWETQNYAQFLEARQSLLAQAANALLEDLSHEAPPVVQAVEKTPITAIPARQAEAIPGGVGDAEEEAILKAVNEWLRGHSLPGGHIEHELSDPVTGDPLAILDLAWPNGLQEGYSAPVALLLEEPPETLRIANDYGFRYFISAAAFKYYVEHEVLGLATEGGIAEAS